MHPIPWFLTFLALTSASLATAQDLSSITWRHAEVHDEGSSADLAVTIDALARRSSEPRWVAWAVAAAPTARPFHCDHEDGELTGVVHLEGGHSFTTDHEEPSSPRPDVLVLVRLAGGRLGRIRPAPSHCVIDAGGLDVHTVGGVSTAASLDVLADLLREASGGRIRDGAAFALAYHDDSRAEEILEDLARTRDAESAVLWLGNARGRPGFEALRRLAADDDRKVRERVTFGLSVTREAEATDVLLRMARHDAARDVRRQAIFWLGQKAGQRITAEIEKLLVEDGDVEIKKQAVFALAQRSDDESIPFLIRQVESNVHPEVRRAALFWLGQKDDPRALDLIEEILTR